MTELEGQLLEELVDLEKTVAGMAAAQNKPDLAANFSRIDRLTGQLPPGTDSSLLHYLHKKSYQKARLYLQGKDEENEAGPCGHV